MDDVPTSTAQTLYHLDFYAWTKEQVALLRQGRVEAIDRTRVLEEIETLGRNEIAELRSRFTLLAQHLLKQMHQLERFGRSWATTILNQHIEIARHMKENPSLQSEAEAVFAEAYEDARELAASETGLALDTFSEAPPFSRDQALREDWPPACEA